MEEYQKRVIAERNELDSKIRKIVGFMQQDEFSPGSNEEHNLIAQQYRAMETYIVILNMRIKLWKTQ